MNFAKNLRNEAIITNNGYRLHLIALNAWFYKIAIGENEIINETVKILSGREPNNAFFAYLNLGRDKKVFDLAKKFCVLDGEQKEFNDWSWQRADSDNAWKKNSKWDCVFIYNLLTVDPDTIFDK